MKLIFTLIGILGIISLGYSQAGSLDPNFNPAGPDSVVWCIAVQDTGKILVSGRNKAGPNIGSLVRLKANGNLDPTFQAGVADSTVYFLEIQPNNRILVTGEFSNFNGSVHNRILRLMPDGNIDSTFINPTMSFGSIWVTLTLPDGKILIGGDFQNYNGSGKSYLARLNPDGTVDASFPSGSGPNNWVYWISRYADGKILISGNFSTYNGIQKPRIARILDNGSIDTGFQPGFGPDNAVYMTAITPDQKIIITGLFRQYDGIQKNYLARLHSNGALDTTFNKGLGPGNAVFTCNVQADGKLIIGGWFTSYHTTNGINRIARVDINGNLDPGFNSGTGANGSVFYSHLQADGRLLIGGEFTTCNNVPRKKVASLFTSQVATFSGTIEQYISSISLSPNPAFHQAQVALYSKKNMHAEVSIVNSAGQELYKVLTRLLAGENQIEFYTGALPPGVYFLVLSTPGVRPKLVQFLKL